MIFKPKFLITILVILLLSLFLFRIDSHAAEEPVELTPGIISHVGPDTDTNRMIDFTNFRTYYISVEPGHRYSYRIFGSVENFEVRTFFCDSVPNVGVQVFNLSSSHHDSSADLTANILGGTHKYACVSVYPGYGPVVFAYDNTTSSDLIGLTNQAINNQTEVILQSTDDIKNSINESSQNIQNSIDKQTEATQQQTQVQQETQNFIKDDTVSDDSMSVDTSSFDTSGSADVDNFFTTFLNTVYDAYTGINSKVEVINIPVPYSSENIVLRSDALSSFVVGTPLYDLIEIFWTFIFGSYLVIFVKRIFDWLSTGEIAEKGVFGFIEWLDVHNEIIKSYMM